MVARGLMEARWWKEEDLDNVPFDGPYAVLFDDFLRRRRHLRLVATVVLAREK